MKKALALILAILMMVTCLAACGEKAATDTGKDPADASEPADNAATDGADDAEPAQTSDEDVVIGVSFQGLSDEYIVRLSDAFQARADELGVTVQVADGQMDAETQVGQVENFIAQKVDVIVLNPISMDGCAPAVEAANEAGIPIITLISITSNQDLASAYVGSDSVESGLIEGQMMVEDLGGKGNIVVMFGQMGHDAQIGRYEGLLQAMEGTDIEIVAEQTGNWSREEGMALMENWLASGKEIDAVVAQNDAMALGALMAIEAKGLTGEIKVYGIDAQAEALDAVENGTMAGTVFQNAEEQGSKCVDVALAAAKGETLESNYYIPYEGVRAADVPNYR